LPLEKRRLYRLSALRIIDGKREGKPHAFGVSLTYSIMQNAPLFQFCNKNVFRHGKAKRDCCAIASQTRAGKPAESVKRVQIRKVSGKRRISTYS